ncbi:MAG TPA: hypothetical protein VEK15_31925, partial [Vicinamibacteria bacterium]|nr:hypothetical protein [Vicinamibacteria bacterium]
MDKSCDLGPSQTRGDFTFPKGVDSPVPTAQELERIERLAEALGRERPGLLSLSPELAHLVATTSARAPTLHLDDQSDITVVAPRHDTSYIQDRARIRAQTGDIVACNAPPVDGYEEYCCEMLGLGNVEWVAPDALRHRRNLASHCWTARAARRRLIRAVKSDGVRIIHPLMGSAAVWHFALLLERATRKRLAVLAAPPEVSRLVNDKTKFAEIVAALFGKDALPRSYAATSMALVARYVKELSGNCERIALKLPDAAGGAGNVVLDAGSLRRATLTEIRRRLKPVLRGIDWRSGEKLQVSGWARDVLSTPSVQTWIPPERHQPPRVDGVFEQLLEGPAFEFIGAQPASLPAPVRHGIERDGLLLASLFQRLGYVGRCSLDLVLTGSTLEDSRLVFIECNGRWGGTSLPMFLVHRL